MARFLFITLLFLLGILIPFINACNCQYPPPKRHPKHPPKHHRPPTRPPPYVRPPKTPVHPPPYVRPPKTPVHPPPYVRPPVHPPPYVRPPVAPVYPPPVVRPPVTPVHPPPYVHPPYVPPPITPPVIPPPVIVPPVIPPPVVVQPPTYPPATGSCPINTLKLNACVDLLGGLVHVVIGNKSRAMAACCPLLKGIVDLDAALCLCTNIRARLLNIDILLPVALQVLSDCGKYLPSDWKCPG